MKLTPTLDRVAIKRDELKKKSKGGIILPNTKKESNCGTVKAVGPGGFNQDGSRREMSVKVGDHVFFTDDYYVTVQDTKTVVVDEDAILAIVGK